VEHTAWLPSGIEAPYAKMNAWRQLVMLTSVWALGCALWVGCTRRVAVQAVFNAVVANGALLALLAILQKVTEATKVFWFIQAKAAYFHGPFFYKNHAGAYFNLLVVLALGLAAWHYVRGLRRLERSTPAPVYVFVAVLLATASVMSGSRAAMILLAGYAVAAITVVLIWRGRTEAPSNHPAVSALLGLAVAGFIGLAAITLNVASPIEQLNRLFTEQGQAESVVGRVMARDATFDLFRDEPLTGWGAGSFRHAFPIHQQNYPRIFSAYGKVFNWDHAHNDYLQALAELGVIGFTLLIATPLWLASRLLRLGALAHPAFLLTALGLALPLAHAWVDFPLYNLAILTTFAAGLVGLVRWVELETRR
jgi:O-antigen ligase